MTFVVVLLRVNKMKVYVHMKYKDRINKGCIHWLICYVSL